MEHTHLKTALIIGAGPAGLSTAYQLLKNSDIKVIIIEKDVVVGGIAKTINFKGNLIDIGPHRYFSKSDVVNDFWRTILDEDNFTKVNRLTRIFYLKKFFNYPIGLSFGLMINLGPWRMIKIAFSYIKSQIKPIKPEKSLADFYINRFGRELYQTFFKDYTHKVWGVPCEQIPADWGKQRVKGLSIKTVLVHAIFSLFKKKRKNTETSLVEQFNYPKYGSGQMYQTLADKLVKMGAEIRLNCQLVGVDLRDSEDLLEGVTVRDSKTGDLSTIKADYVISSMPIKDLVASFQGNVSVDMKEIASGLVYRDYILVALLFKEMSVDNRVLPDNWIYIQEKDIKMGRLDIINNFSLFMLKDPNNVCLGAEYFCNEADDFWKKDDEEIKDFAVGELEKMKMIDRTNFLDFMIIRQKKAYPAYFGSYIHFDKLKNYLNQFQNLYLVGRNGMHKYNNMDHSILAGFAAAEAILSGGSKEMIWSINTEEEYHEERKREK